MAACEKARMVKSAKNAVATAAANVLVNNPPAGDQQATVQIAAVVPPTGELGTYEARDETLALLLYDAIYKENAAREAKEAFKRELILKRGDPKTPFTVQVPSMNASIEITWKEPLMEFQIDPRLQKTIDDLIVAAKASGTGKTVQKRTGYYAASIKNN
jgi:hypothetical protein